MLNKYRAWIIGTLIFLTTYLICLPSTLNYCQTIREINFDTQNLFFWDYLHEMGYRPYIDTLYLYGLLFFYKSQILVYYILYTLLSPFLLTLIYFTVIRPLFSHRFLKLVIYASILLIAINYLGLQIFSRYGLLTSLTLFSSYIIFNFSKTKKTYFLLGVISGLLLFVSNADALYIFAAQFLLIIFDHFVNLRSQKSFALKSLLFKIPSFFLGFIVGATPLIIHLTQNHMWGVISHFYNDIRYGAEYGKVPYLIDNSYEVFILISLIVGLVILSIRSYSSKLRQTYLTYAIFASFLSLTIMLQKHLVRPMANTLFYFSYILIIILFVPVMKDRPLLRTILFISIIFSLISFLHLPLNTNYLSQLISSYSPNEISHTFNYSQKLCRLKKANWQQLQLPSEFKQVADYIKSQPTPHQIFAFPYDPLFYTILNQKPAPYPNLYSASPKNLQEKNIDFLKNQPVDYVIYNHRALMIDAAPDYLRGSDTFRYLINNYSPVKYYDPYIILKRNEARTPGTFFSKENIIQFPEPYKHLSQIWWGSVPYSEAKYKELDLFKTASNTAYFDNIDELSRFLQSNPLDTPNTYLLVHSPSSSPETNEIYLSDENNYKVRLLYIQKANSNHLIHLSNLPNFMDGGKITSVNFTTKPEYVWVINNPNDIGTW